MLGISRSLGSDDICFSSIVCRYTHQSTIIITKEVETSPMGQNSYHTRDMAVQIVHRLRLPAELSSHRYYSNVLLLALSPAIRLWARPSPAPAG